MGSKTKLNSATESSFKIAVLPGDGIGPEVMEAAQGVLAAVSKKFNLQFEFNHGLIGGAALDAEGTPLPEDTLKLCRSADAVLLGSVGGPKWDALPPEKRPERGGLLALRKQLNLFVNLRPVRVYPSISHLSPLNSRRLEKGVDLLTVRELSGGIYFGEPKEKNDASGLDTMYYDKQTVSRVARLAFEAAGGRRNKLTSVDKANVLYSSLLWRETVEDLALEYPEVKLDHMYVDNAAMQMIVNPGQFDVILTGNLFGDILSDESAALPGTLGVLPSASLGDSVHLFEPAGGSAPDLAGLDKANPVAQILSAAMMCEYGLGLPDAAAAIREAVEQSFIDGICTADLLTGSDRPAAGTTAVARAIAGYII
ncbi:MAG: 3-isopropylmalate dehydrogenase [Spirochaetia bacterium]